MSRLYEAMQRAELEQAEAITKEATEFPQAKETVAEPAKPPVALTLVLPSYRPMPPGPALVTISAAEVAPAPPEAAAAKAIPVPAPILLQTTPIEVETPQRAQPPSLVPQEPFPAAASSNLTVQTTPWEPMVESLPALQERGAAVEQFHHLRSRLFDLRNQSPIKTVLIASGSRGEGRSFIAINLAISLAMYETNRVLLIDGDLRRSSLHTVLKCPKSPGVAEYLVAQADLSEILQRPTVTEGQVMASGLAALTFISAGDLPERAADLSGNGLFDRLIAEVAPLFDWIIVDSSPVNLVTDAVNLARACDAVLLITQHGVTTIASAQHALLELKTSNVVGVVLNAMTKRPGSSDYDEHNETIEKRA